MSIFSRYKPKFSRRTVTLFLAGFICLSVISFNAAGEIFRVDTISQSAALPLFETKQQLLILDVRSPSEYSSGHIPGAINIEFRQIRNRIHEIEKFRSYTVVIYCETGIRARVAESTLTKAGFKSLLHLEGHMSAWRKNSLPLNNPNF